MARTTITAQKPVHRQSKILIQRDLLIVQSEQFRINGIETIGNVGKNHLFARGKDGIEAILVDEVPGVTEVRMDSSFY